jgi:ABC-type nitrate/sulfonate/bicarbonate transport system substrate-binding protein
MILDGFRMTRRNMLVTSGLLIAGTAVSSVARAQAPKLEKVVIAGAASNLATTLQELMAQQNFLAKFGLSSEPMLVTDGSKLTGSIIAGDVDICPLSGYSQLFPAIAKGATLKMTHASIRYGQQTIFSGNPEVKSVADLKGKTIGVGPLGAQLHQVTVALLLKNGVNPADVRFANIGSSADVYRAVVAKVVDAGPSQIDNIPDSEKNGVHQIKGGDMWTDLREYPFQGGYASDATIGKKREVIVRTLAAYATLFRFLSGPDSKDAFFAARRKALGKSGEDFDRSSEFQWNFIQKTQPFALDLVLPKAGIDYVQDLNIRLDIQKQRLPFEKAVDASLAQDAVKLV